MCIPPLLFQEDIAEFTSERPLFYLGVWRELRCRPGRRTGQRRHCSPFQPENNLPMPCEVCDGIVTARTNRELELCGRRCCCGWQSFRGFPWDFHTFTVKHDDAAEKLDKLFIILYGGYMYMKQKELPLGCACGNTMNGNINTSITRSIRPSPRSQEKK